MRNYENACAKFYDRIKVKPFPLNSFEFRKDYFSDAFLYKKIQAHWNIKKNYLKQSQKENRELLITDINFKIVFATNTISRINGYQPTEILGKSPAVFQGEATSDTTKQKIKTALTNLEPFKEVILNYKKNGETYWCEIEAYPMFDKNGDFQNYIALEKIAS